MSDHQDDGERRGEGPVGLHQLFLNEVPYQNYLVATQDVGYEEKTHRGNEGEDDTRQEARERQFERDGPKGLHPGSAQISSCFNQLPIKLLSAGVDREDHEWNQGIYHAHNYSRVRVEQFQRRARQTHPHEYPVERSVGSKTMIHP